MTLANSTPYVVGELHHLDRDGFDVVTFVVKATFELVNGTLRLADEQEPLRSNDVLFDESSDWSSSVLPADLGPPKLGADIVVVGEACLPERATATDVLVRVGDLAAPLRVHGPRLFEMGATGLVVGQALHVDAVPLVYEMAYGGIAKDFGLLEERNPSGRGLAQSLQDLEGKRAPQIEHPDRPHLRAGQVLPPMGTAPIPAHWSPRKDYFGTVDLAWRKTRMPLLPLDFDLRFNNVAHPSLQLPVPLRPGTPVAVSGMTRGAPVVFDVPPLGVLLRARYDQGQEEVTPPLDTLVIYPDQAGFELMARATFRIGRKNQLRGVQVDLT